MVNQNRTRNVSTQTHSLRGALWPRGHRLEAGAVSLSLAWGPALPRGLRRGKLAFSMKAEWQECNGSFCGHGLHPRPGRLVLLTLCRGRAHHHPLPDGHRSPVKAQCAQPPLQKAGPLSASRRLGWREPSQGCSVWAAGTRVVLRSTELSDRPEVKTLRQGLAWKPVPTPPQAPAPLGELLGSALATRS